MFKVSMHPNDGSEADSHDALRFLNSLKELKDLRSQIHDAANYCEKTFLNSDKKADVLDNTREYLCRAVVTVVDHLGSVSANLNRSIQNTDRVAETELRINCLKQKLDSCDQYNRNFTLPKKRWTTNLPQHHPHYISAPSDSNCRELSLQFRGHNPPTEVIEKCINEFKTKEDMPSFMYTSPKKICLDFSPKSPLDYQAKDLTSTWLHPFSSATLLTLFSKFIIVCIFYILVMPVSDGISIAPKLLRNPSFHFQETRKPGGIRKLLKSMNEKEIISFIRRSKWEPSRFLKFKP